MGHQPRARHRDTRGEVLRRLYVSGAIEVDDFEFRVGALLRQGRVDEPCPPPPADWRRTWWPVVAVNERPPLAPTPTTAHPGQPATT